MKAVLAIIFFACIAGSMAARARVQSIDTILAQAQSIDTILAQVESIAQGIFSQLESTVLASLQGAVSQISAAIGGRFDLFNDIVSQFKPILDQFTSQALSQVLGSLSGIFGGARVDLSAIFDNLFAEIQTQVNGITQQFLNQGLAGILGGFGSRGIDDILSSISSTIATAVAGAQSALTGALSNLQTLGSQILDASKPHFEQLQEQLAGHGLNVLGSISETINNVHGSLVGGR
ncbi:unnamed protein product [Adineta ricciae]|nr:unnamed protein product [Adineta ricciae]